MPIFGLLQSFKERIVKLVPRHKHKWARKTLVVGPAQPVDGDSIASTKALIMHLRKSGRQAYTLPVLTMYPQLKWIFRQTDMHPACGSHASADFVTKDLQAAYDAMLAVWCPDEIVLVDGQPSRLGFDPRGIPVYTIDHHLDNGTCDNKHAYIQAAPSAGCLLIHKFQIYEPILVVSILTDTFWLRQNQPAQALEALYLLRKHAGLTDDLLTDIQARLMPLKNPEVMVALAGCDLRYQGRAVFVVLKDEKPEIHRGVVGELGYFFRHLCVVRGDGYVSLKTRDGRKSVRPLATKFGGGGHDNMAAAQLQPMNVEQLAELYDAFMAEFAESD